jgi:hypothetical protein
MAKISAMKWNYDQFGIVATLQLADNVRSRFTKAIEWRSSV